MQGQARCAFYIANAEQTRLKHVAGMPEDYVQKVGDVPIDENSIACGLAAYRREAVITPDVNTEPHWKEWIWLAREY